MMARTAAVLLVLAGLWARCANFRCEQPILWLPHAGRAAWRWRV